MTPLPYRYAGAGVAFYAVVITFVLLELRLRLRSGLNRSGARSDRGSIVVVWASVAGGMLAGFLIATDVRSAAIDTPRWPLFVAGMAVMVAGIVIRQWSVAMLGGYFTTDVRVHPGQAVVDSGPYRWVRHPSYAGLLITMLGLGLALGNWAGLAVLVVVPTAGLVFRIRVEERALLEGIGEPYRRFAATRAHLVPGVW